MPIIEDIKVGQNRLGLWRIDGTESRFESEFPEATSKLSVKHPRTQLQRFASRLLLAEMLGGMPRIEKTEHGKPILPELDFEVSISHTESHAIAFAIYTPK